MTNCTKEKEDKDLQPTNRLRSISATEDTRTHAFSGRKLYGDMKGRSGLPSSIGELLVQFNCKLTALCLVI